MQVTMRKVDGPKHDPRPTFVFRVGKNIVLRIAGYDMLPHLIMKTTPSYHRIQWEEFREILTTGKISQSLKDRYIGLE